MARWQDYILRGIRADQPTGPLVTIGTLYCVTDEDDIIERWSGSAWESYSPTTSGFGDVSGPAASIDSEIVLFDGTTGKLIKRATGSGPVHAASGVYSAAPINLAGGATEITGDLPYANLQPSLGASRLLGRGSSGGSGDWQDITLGSNLTMTGTVLDSTGGSGGSVIRDTNGFRLTLASGEPDFAPTGATPSATDTVNEIVTFSADPGFYDGTIVTVSATVGGLTAGTRYFMHRISATTYSFHTTVADAMSGASRINLTASITSQVLPSGISTTGIYFTPYLSNQIALYDGYDWVLVDHAEFSVGLGTLTADTNYDLFLDYNGGTPNLYIGTAWSTATARAVALTRQDGVYVSSADAQSRYIGTFRTNSTTTVIDDGGGISSQVGGKRFLWNKDNRLQRYVSVGDATSSWTYNSATWRQANSGGGANGNKIEVVVGLAECYIDLIIQTAAGNTGANAVPSVAINEDVTNSLLPNTRCSAQAFTTSTLNTTTQAMAKFSKVTPLGYHQYYWLEACLAGAVTGTFFGQDPLSGIRGILGTVWC